MTERILELCTKLQLPVTANSWSTMAGQATKNNIPYSAFLERLLEAELYDKHLRSAHTLLKLSGFPFRKTLDEFQFEARPNIDEG